MDFGKLASDTAWFVIRVAVIGFVGGWLLATALFLLFKGGTQ